MTGSQPDGATALRATSRTGVRTPVGGNTERRGAGGRWLLVPLAIFVLTRCTATVLLVLAAHHQQALGMHEPGVTMYRPMPASPSYFTMITNWDGQWYRSIAEHGYPHSLPRIDGVVQQNAWAFFPLYPALVWLVMTITTLPFGPAASLVSVLCAGAAMCVLYRMVAEASSRWTAALTVLALCSYPAAPVLQTAYTEGLALLEIVACCWLLRRQNYLGVLAVSLLMALTRPIVLPVALMVAAHVAVRWARRREHPFAVRERWLAGVTVVLVALSFWLWPLVTAVVTGEPNGYLLTQSAWVLGAKSWPTWLGVSLHGLWFVLGLVLWAVAMLALTLLRRKAARWGLEYRLWAGAYALYLLGATRTTGSIVRYAMLAIVPWWPFPEFGDDRVPARLKWLVAGFIFVAGLATQYLWVRWLFVARPNAFQVP